MRYQPCLWLIPEWDKDRAGGTRTQSKGDKDRAGGTRTWNRRDKDGVCHTKEQYTELKVFFQVGTNIFCNKRVPVLQVPVNVSASGSTHTEPKEAKEKLILIILISKFLLLIFCLGSFF